MLNKVHLFVSNIMGVPEKNLCVPEKNTFLARYNPPIPLMGFRDLFYGTLTNEKDLPFGFFSGTPSIKFFRHQVFGRDSFQTFNPPKSSFKKMRKNG